MTLGINSFFHLIRIQKIIIFEIHEDQMQNKHLSNGNKLIQ